MRRVLLLVCSVSIAAASVGAQSDPVPGARVRVTAVTSGSRLVGTVVGSQTDTLVVRACPACAGVHIPTASIRALEISTGRGIDKRRAWTGVALGMAVGLTIGTVHGRRSDRACPSQGSFCGVAGVVEPAAGAVLGALAGLIPAFALPVEHWRPVKLWAGA